MTTEQPHAATVNADDRLTALHEQLVDQIRALRTGEDWTAWLALAARLYTYSFNNVLLIARQRPDATNVAGYRAWQQLGRQVDKGEHGIRILAPVIRHSATDGVTFNADAHDAVARAVVGYRVGYVWDVSQTHGRPLPERPRPILLPGQAPEGLWDALTAQVTARGFVVSRGPCAGGANGVTDLVARTVRVRADVDDAQALKTLAHELGHILMHDGHERLDCRGVVEVEAESVAYLVTAHHGLSSDAYTFPYVLTWAAAVGDDEPEAVVDRVAQRVVHAARLVLSNQPLAPPVPAVLSEVRQVSSDTPSDARVRTATTTGQLLAIHEDAAAYFASELLGSWVPEYLAGRWLSDVLAPDSPWRVGHAPAGWTSLVDHLRELGYSDETIEVSGFTVKARTGHLVDRFRDRLMVAIRREDGCVVGFVGRARPNADDDSPKYLNSPTTAIFRKGEHLLGIHEGRDALARGATPVLTEGPLDAIAVALASPDHAPSALCGTALTHEHIATLGRLTTSKRVVMALDADAAGSGATRRAYTALRAQGLTPMLADLPPGNDPADVLQAHGPARLAHAVGPRATPLVDTLVEQRVGDFKDRMRWVEGRVAAVRAVAPLIQDCGPSHRRVLAHRVADWTGVDLSTVLTELSPTTTGGTPGAVVASSTPSFRR
jgi:DNA primase